MMLTPLDRPTTPPPSSVAPDPSYPTFPSPSTPSPPPTPTLPPSYPSSPNQNDRDPINPPGLLRFRPAHLRTPATSPMRAGATARAQAAQRRLRGPEEEVEEEAGGEVGEVGAESFEGVVDVRSVDVEGDVDVDVDVQEAALNLELSPVAGVHSSESGTSPISPPGLLRGRRYTVALIDEGLRASVWRPPRPRTPVPSPVRGFEGGSEGEGEEDGGDGDDEAEIGIEVEGASEDEGKCEDEGNDESEGDSRTAEGTFGLGSVRELVPLLRTLNAEHPFGAGAVPQLVDVAWPAGSSAEESSGDEEEDARGEESGDEGESVEGENGLERIAEEGEPVNGADDGESIRMVPHGGLGDSRSELRGDGEGERASGQGDPLFQGEGQVALVGSQTYFLHLPLADRPRRGRGLRGGAQVQRLGWWMSL